MKAVSRDQTTEIGARFLTDTNWGGLEHDALQAVISLPRDELGRRFTAFLRNRCQLAVKGPGTLVIDRAKLPTPEKFIGKGWEAIEHDERSLALTEVDFSKAVFDCPLREDEQYITGEEKLEREKADGKIRLDFGFAMALFHEKGQATLRFLHDTHGVTWMEFTGTVLRSSDGSRCFLCLFRDGDGSWRWGCRWLDSHRNAKRVSVRLAS